MSKRWSILAFGSGCSYSGVSCLHFPHRSVWVNRFASMWAAFPLGCWFSRRSVSCRHFHSFWFLLWAAWVFTQPTFFLCLIFFYSFLVRRAFAVAAAISRISCEAKVVVCPGGGLLLGHYRLHLNCGGGGRLWVSLFKGSGGRRVWEEVLWQILEVELWADIEEELFLNALSGHWSGIVFADFLNASVWPSTFLIFTPCIFGRLSRAFWVEWKERSRALWAERDRRIPALRDRRKRKIDQCEGSEPRERGFLQLFLQGICGCLQDFRLLADACRFFGFSGSFLLGFSSKIVGLRLPELGSSAPRTRSVHFRWPLLSAVFLSFLVVLGRYMNRSDLFLVNFYDSIFADDIWTCEVQLHSLSWTWISCFLRQFFCMYWQLIVGSVFGFLRYIVLFLEAIICLYCQLF